MIHLTFDLIVRMRCQQSQTAATTTPSQLPTTQTSESYRYTLALSAVKERWLPATLDCSALVAASAVASAQGSKKVAS